MQISGDDFVKKVQLKQEKDELEKKLSELDETRISMANINLTNNLNNAYKGMSDNNINDINRLQKNIEFDENSNDFDNIMLNQPSPPEDNKKKYLILSVVLIVLFLLTIIIIKLLSGDTKKEDSFTSNNIEASQMKPLDESNSIEDRYQKILDDRAKQDSNNSSENNSLTNTTKEQEEAKTTATQTLNETKPKDEIPDETIEETIRKIKNKKTNPSSSKATAQTTKPPVVKTTTNTTKTIKDLVEGKEVLPNTKGFFIQIGAFSKKPDSKYLQNISKNGFSYKVVQQNVNGKLFNKVLIGPYSSKATANNNISSIKSKLNTQNAFIVNY